MMKKMLFGSVLLVLAVAAFSAVSMRNDLMFDPYRWLVPPIIAFGSLCAIFSVGLFVSAIRQWVRP